MDFDTFNFLMCLLGPGCRSGGDDDMVQMQMLSFWWIPAPAQSSYTRIKDVLHCHVLVLLLDFRFLSVFFRPGEEKAETGLKSIPHKDLKNTCEANRARSDTTV